MFPRAVLLLLLSSVLLSDAFPCCAYHGSGGATLLGQGTYPFPQRSEVTPFLVGIIPDVGTALYVNPTLAPGAKAPTAPAGWIILANSSAPGGQTLHAWGPGGFCQVVSMYFGPINACFGGADSNFQRLSSSISFGGVAASLWAQEGNGTFATVLDEGCAPVNILGADTPAVTGGGGAWSFTVVEGGGAGPDPAWMEPPSYC